MASGLFPGEDPLGRTLALDGGGDEPLILEVVGVVGEVTTSRLAGDGRYAMYASYRQREAMTMRVGIRTRGAPGSITPAVRDVLRQLDGDIPLAGVQTMNEVLSQSVADRRAITAVLGMFAVVALLLAAVGLYGVMAYQVSRRTREIGIRIALGATTGGVTGVVLGGGLRLVAAGLLLGLPAALLSARLVQGMLFGVGTADPVTFAGMSVFLGGIATVACLVPARRAARTDPAEAFRAD
jgi:putative ABC transport system permease protein